MFELGCERKQETGDAAVQTDEVATDVRLRLRRRLKPLHLQKSLLGRQIYKTRRSAVQAEWQNLMA